MSTAGEKLLNAACILGGIEHAELVDWAAAYSLDPNAVQQAILGIQRLAFHEQNRLNVEDQTRRAMLNMKCGPRA